MTCGGWLLDLNCRRDNFFFFCILFYFFHFRYFVYFLLVSQKFSSRIESTFIYFIN